MESYSNLAYNLAGFAGFFFHGDLLFCMALQALGAASFTYHYHKTQPIYLFDWWAMAFVISIIGAQVMPTPFVIWTVILWNVVYPYFLLGRFRNLKFGVYLETGFSIVPVLVILLIVRPLPVFLSVLALFLCAAYIRSLDPDVKNAKSHDSIEHSVWHLITGLGFYIARFVETL